MVIAHTQELIQQAVDKIQMVWPDVDIGVCQGEHKKYENQVIVASIQSASQEFRLGKLKQQDFALLIIDEAHHAVADTYQKVAEQLGFLPPQKALQSGKLLLGFTATAVRGDRRPLGDVFQEIIFRRSIGSMIKAGYLADLRGKKCRAVADLRGVGSNSDQTDFNTKQLVAAINTHQRNQIIVEAYKTYCDNKKGLAFTADVNHAQDLAKAFMCDGIPAAAVYGAMPDKERAAILSLFSTGELRVITNCMVLTEGYDQPDIECLLMARPTKSATLYTQMVGRGTRIHPTKTECLVIEFTDNDHDVCSLGTLEGVEIQSDQTLLEALEQADKQEEAFTANTRQAITEDYDLIGRSAFTWFPLPGKRYKIDINNKLGHFILLIPTKTGRYYVLLYRYNVRCLWLTNGPVGIEYAQGMAEDWLRENETTVLVDRKADWRKQPATRRQINTMNQFGIKWEPGITKGEGADKLSQFFNKINESDYSKPTQELVDKLHEKRIYPGEGLIKSEAKQLLNLLSAAEQGVPGAKDVLIHAIHTGDPPKVKRQVSS